MNKILRITLLAALTMSLADCARVRESRFNPFNWFGRSSEAAVPAVEDKTPDDPRLLVDQVTQMEIVRTASGAIVQATGLPPTQGWWKAELVADNDGEAVDGVMTYRFVVFPPSGGTPASTPQSREVTAAAYITNFKLESINQVVVLGDRNSRTSRR